MSNDIQVAIIAGGFTLLGVLITLGSSWIQSMFEHRKINDRLQFESLQKRKAQLGEARKQYLNYLRTIMAELLEIDREGAKIQSNFEHLLESNINNPTDTNINPNVKSSAEKFIAYNQRSDKINAELKKCLDQSGDSILDNLVNDVINISAELFGETIYISGVSSKKSAERSDQIKRRKELSKQLLIKKQLVNNRIEQLLCGDENT